MPALARAFTGGVIGGASGVLSQRRILSPLPSKKNAAARFPLLYRRRKTMALDSALETLARLRASWQRLLRNRRSMAELAACPPSELHRIARDVGLSANDLRALTCSHPGPSELLPKRLQQLGLDPRFIKHARTTAYRDLERICATCMAWRRCTRDLAKGDVQAGMGSYCPNAPSIDVLTVDRPGSPRAV